MMAAVDQANDGRLDCVLGKRMLSLPCMKSLANGKGQSAEPQKYWSNHLENTPRCERKRMSLRLSPTRISISTPGTQVLVVSLKNGKKIWRRPGSDARSRDRAEADRDYRKRQHHLMRQSFDIRIDELVVRLFCGIHRQLLLSVVESAGKLFIRRLNEVVRESSSYLS